VTKESPRVQLMYTVDTTLTQLLLLLPYVLDLRGDSSQAGLQYK
jgi:hypothetical protein